MPTLPTYDSQRNIEARLPEPPRQEAKARAEMGAPLIEAAGEMLTKWNSAMDTMQYTSSSAKFNTALADIKSRAANDPDINAFPKYQKEIDEARKESLKGFQNKQVEQKAAFEFDYDAKIAQISIGDGFRKKQIDFGQAELLRGIDALTQRSVAATAPAEAAKAEKDIEDLINANVSGGIITAEDGAKQLAKIKEELPILKAKNMIDADPKLAEEMLVSNDFGIDDPSKRRELINLAKDIQDSRDYDFTRTKVQARFDTISQIANGEIDFKNADALIYQTATVDPELAEAMKKIFKDKGGYEVEETSNEDFQELAQEIFAAKDSETASKFLMRALKENKQISRDRLAVLVDAAKMRAVNLPVKQTKKFNPPAALKEVVPGPGKLTYFDAATLALTSAVSPAAFPGVFVDVMKRFKAEDTQGENMIYVVSDEVRKQRLKDNSWIGQLPKGGQLRVDRFGNKAIVYPDGSYEEVMSGAGEYMQKEPGKTRPRK